MTPICLLSGLSRPSFFSGIRCPNRRNLVGLFLLGIFSFGILSFGILSKLPAQNPVGLGAPFLGTHAAYVLKNGNLIETFDHIATWTHGFSGAPAYLDTLDWVTLPHFFIIGSGGGLQRGDSAININATGSESGRSSGFRVVVDASTRRCTELLIDWKKINTDCNDYNPRACVWHVWYRIENQTWQRLDFERFYFNHAKAEGARETLLLPAALNDRYFDLAVVAKTDDRLYENRPAKGSRPRLAIDRLEVRSIALDSTENPPIQPPLDTLPPRDTIIQHDTIVQYDTLIYRDTIETYLPVWIHDTILVPEYGYLHDTLTDTLYIAVHDTVKEVVYVPAWVHDTTIIHVPQWFFDTILVHDTLWITDTIWITGNRRSLNASEPPTVSPNPSRDHLTISSGEPIRAIRWIDLQGKEFAPPFQGQLQQREYDVSALPRGCYLVRIETRMERWVVKVLVVGGS